MWSDSNGQIFLAACTAAALFHCHIIGTHALTALNKMRDYLQRGGQHAMDAGSVEEEMEKLRALNLRYGGMVICHLDLLYVLHSVWNLLHDQNIPHAYDLASAFCAYGVSLGISSGHVAPSRKVLGFANFVLIPMVSLGAWDPHLPNTDTGLRFQAITIVHMMAAFLYLDMTMFIPSALLQSLISVAASAYFRGSSQLTAEFVCLHVWILLGRIGILCLFEIAVHNYLGSNQKLEKAHSMIAGFQKILKGLSDGSLLLDEQLRIHGPSTSLQQLLVDRTDFTGVDFESLIVDAEGRERFAAFIEASRAAAGEPMSAPSCLRLALRSGSGGVVSLDAFHATVPGLSGSKEPYHLLAFLEDTDCRPAMPAPPGGVPQPWQWPHLGPPRQAPCASSQASSRASTAGSAAMDALETLQVVRELEEATFVIDSQTEELTILEAHLKFVQAPTDVEFKLHLPSVKSISRHTDWPNLQRDLTHYAHRLRRGAPDLPARLRPLRVCIPGNPRKYLKAQYAQLSCANRTLLRDGLLFLHLHLKNFNKTEAHPTRPVSRFQGFAFPEEEEQSDDDGDSSEAASSAT